MKNFGVESPKFSKIHGLYDSPIELVIISETSDATIYFTTDSSTPTRSSNIYSQSLKINKTTIVKAIAIDAKGNCSLVTSSSYIFPSDVIYQTDTPEGYPSTWGNFVRIGGVAPADYGMDPLVAYDELLKEKIIDGFYQLPIVSVSGDKDGFFSHELDSVKGGIYIYTGVANTELKLGRGWERPVSFEIFDNVGDLDFTVNCGIRIHGGNSRVPEFQPKHSFRLHFKSKYGPSKLCYPLFGEEGPMEFNDIILRSFYNNSWTHRNPQQRTRAQYERDLWMRVMQKKLGHPSSSGCYCHLFLNGLYWGLYCLTERINGNYCKNNFGGEKGDYTVVKVDEYNNIELEEGSLDDWNLIMQFLDDNIETSLLYEKLSELLDIDNFIDYIILNQYVGNTDWDFHNWIIFKHNSGGKFKFVCWDSETIFGDIDVDITSLNNKSCPTSIFSKLIQSDKFKARFSKRAISLLSSEGALSPEKVQEVWDSLYLKIDCALYAEAARWGDYRKMKYSVEEESIDYTVDCQYQTERNRLLYEYFPARTAVYYGQLERNNWLENFETNIPNSRKSKKYDFVYDLFGNKLSLEKMKKGAIYILNGKLFFK